MLEIKNIYSGYGDITIIEDVSLSIEEGEVVTILGPNGAGKTTLLKSVVGLIRPNKGDIFFRGEKIAGENPQSLVTKGLVYVPEERELFPKMSVMENLEMGATARRKTLANNIDRIFDLFPRLEERHKQKASTLSGGEQQMLAIARALMSEPDLLLLDEPSLGLAPKIIDTVEKIILDVVEGENTSVLLVEQNAEMAMSVSGRGYILQNGKIVENGQISQIKETEFIRDAYL